MINLFYDEKHSFIEWTYVEGAHWDCLLEAMDICCMCPLDLQLQYVPATYVTEIKETYFEIYTKQVSCPLTFLF